MVRACAPENPSLPASMCIMDFGSAPYGASRNNDLRVKLGADLMHRLKLLRGRRRIGVGRRRLQPLPLSLLHVGIVFRRAAPGRDVLGQAARPLWNCVADGGGKPFIDRRTAANDRCCQRERGDCEDMAGAD